MSETDRGCFPQQTALVQIKLRPEYYLGQVIMRVIWTLVWWLSDQT